MTLLGLDENAYFKSLSSCKTHKFISGYRSSRVECRLARASCEGDTGELHEQA